MARGHSSFVNRIVVIDDNGDSVDVTASSNSVLTSILAPATMTPNQDYRSAWVDLRHKGNFIFLLASINPFAVVDLEWSNDGVTQVGAAQHLTNTPTSGFNVYLDILNVFISGTYVRTHIVNGATAQNPPTYIAAASAGKDSYIPLIGLNASLSTILQAVLTRSVVAGTKPDGSFANAALTDLSGIQVGIENARANAAQALHTQGLRNQVEHIFSASRGADAIARLINRGPGGIGGQVTLQATRGQAKFECDAAPGSTAYWTSDTHVTYESGNPLHGGQTIVLDAPLVGDAEVTWGYADPAYQNVIGWKRTATTTSTFLIRNGSLVFDVTQTNWNRDKCLGPTLTPNSKFIFNGAPQALSLTQNNIYEEDFRWHGAAGIAYSIVSPNLQTILANVLELGNNQTQSSVPDPDLFLFIRIKNDSTVGGTTPVFSGSWRGGSYSSTLAVEARAITQSSFAPDTRNVSGGPGDLQVDAAGNLMARSQVLTDEGSLRDHFIGTNIATSLSGSLIFSNGNNQVHGLGTAFLSELTTDDHIKLDSDGESSWMRVAEVIDDKELILAGIYAGTSGVGAASHSQWMTITPTGGSITVGGGRIQTRAGTTTGNIAGILRDFDYSPLSYIFRGKHTPGTGTNQLTFYGFQDAFGDPTGATPQEQCVVIFDDSLPHNQLRFRTSMTSSGTETQDQVVTLPAGTDITQDNLYIITLTPESASLQLGTKIVAQAINQHLPRPYTTMQAVMGAAITGAGVTAASTLDCDFVFLQNQDRVEIALTFRGDPITSRIQGTSATTGLPEEVGTDGQGRMLVNQGSDFARLLNRSVENTEQLKLDVEPTNTDYYIGKCADGTADNVATHNVIRIYLSATKNPTAMRFRTALRWDQRTLGW